MNLEINNDLIWRVKVLSDNYLFESENINMMVEEIIRDWLYQVSKDLTKIDIPEEKR